MTSPDDPETALRAAARARAARIESELAEADAELRRLHAQSPRAESRAIVDRIAPHVGAARPKGAPAKRGVRRLFGAKMAGAATFVAMAAVALLWIRRGGPDDLPAYGLVAQAGVAHVRGTAASDRAAERLVLTRGQEIVLVARPAADVVGPIEARAYVRAEGRNAPWPGSIDVAAGGAVRLASTVREIAGPAAPSFDAEVVVGRPGSLPRTADERRAHANVLRVHVDIVPEGDGGP